MTAVVAARARRSFAQIMKSFGEPGRCAGIVEWSASCRWSGSMLFTSFKRVRSSGRENGCSLLEAVLATGLMAGALTSLGQMFAISVANSRSARAGSYATVLAQQKLEQLRGLTWSFDSLGRPISDTSTNTAAAIETPTGGTGLSRSPAGTLTSSTSGWVDYVDEAGSVLGGGTAVLPGTAYIRRWAVEPLPTSPANAIVLQVQVTARVVRGAADSDGSNARQPDEARLTTIKTRKAR